ERGGFRLVGTLSSGEVERVGGAASAFRGGRGRKGSEERPRRRADASGTAGRAGKRLLRSRYSLRRCWERGRTAAVEEGPATGEGDRSCCPEAIRNTNRPPGMWVGGGRRSEFPGDAGAGRGASRERRGERPLNFGSKFDFFARCPAPAGPVPRRPVPAGDTLWWAQRPKVNG